MAASRKVGETILMLGAEIKAQRRRRGNMSQAELAKACGVAVSVLCLMETGRAAIDVEQLTAIAAVFGLSIEEFVAIARRHWEAPELDELPRPAESMVTSFDHLLLTAHTRIRPAEEDD